MITRIGDVNVSIDSSSHPPLATEGLDELTMLMLKSPICIIPNLMIHIEVSYDEF